MSGRSIHMLIAFVMLCVPFGSAAFGAWVARPLRTGLLSPVTNVDVVVSPTGDVSVGYAMPLSGLGGDMGFISTLPTGEATFDHQALPSSAHAASLDADTFGSRFMATREHVPGDVRVGQDLGPFGGVIDQIHPDSVQFGSATVPTITLDRHGIPHVAGVGVTGERIVSSFDVATATWETQTVPTFGLATVPGAFHNTVSLAFDADNQPVVGYVAWDGGDPSGISLAPMVVARGGDTGFRDLSEEAALPRYGVSVASNGAGDVGFASVAADGLAFGHVAQGMFQEQRELISVDVGLLTPRSLAFDPNDSAAVVYGASPVPGLPGPLHLSRRIGPSLWSDEILPVDVILASVAFDSAGHVYIAATTAEGIWLISDNVPRAPGDVNGDGVVDVTDLGLLASQWGTDGSGHGSGWSADIAPAPDGDGIVNVVDLGTLAANWEGGGGGSSPNGAAIIPAPTSGLAGLSLLSVMGLTCRRRAA